jgi:hypothetical protein
MLLTFFLLQNSNVQRTHRSVHPVEMCRMVRLKNNFCIYTAEFLLCQ